MRRWAEACRNLLDSRMVSISAKAGMAKSIQAAGVAPKGRRSRKAVGVVE